MPFKIWVAKTAGNIAAAAVWTAGLVVNPAKIQSRLKYVDKDKVVATVAPNPTDVLMRCRSSADRTCGVCVDVSAISRANKVWTATATASQICVVANPSWKVRLYAADATLPNKAA